MVKNKRGYDFATNRYEIAFGYSGLISSLTNEKLYELFEDTVHKPFQKGEFEYEHGTNIGLFMPYLGKSIRRGETMYVDKQYREIMNSTYDEVLRRRLSDIIALYYHINQTN